MYRILITQYTVHTAKKLAVLILYLATLFVALASNAL